MGLAARILGRPQGKAEGLCRESWIFWRARAARGRLNRREFLGRAAALGLTLPAATKLLTSAAYAQGPQKGGDLLVGLVGGESTNSLDPAKTLTQVPQVFGKTWGETLVYAGPTDSSPQPMLAESWEASDDVKEWRFKIRKGVTFHDGKELTPDDVIATFRRHSDAEHGIRRQRRDGGHRRHEGGRRQRRHHAEQRRRRPAASPHRLPSRHPAERRHGQSRRRHRHRALQGGGRRAGRAASLDEV